MPLPLFESDRRGVLGEFIIILLNGQLCIVVTKMLEIEIGTWQECLKIRSVNEDRQWYYLVMKKAYKWCHQCALAFS